MRKLKTKVAIIGAGAIGRAIHATLKRTGAVSVSLYDSDPRNPASGNSLESAVKSAEIVFLCVPSQAESAATREILPFLGRKAGVISFAKGIEADTGAFMNAVLRSRLPVGQPFGFFGGPMLSKEVLTLSGGAGVIGSRSHSLRRRLKKLFQGTTIRIETTADARGVALSGMLKNVYACAMGIAEGLLWGDNKRGWLGCAAISEMLALTKLLGGKRETFLGAAGIGDFLATGFGASSRNRKMGEEMARLGKVGYKAESFYSVAPLIKILGKRRVDFPLLSAVHAVMATKKPAAAAFDALFLQ